MIVFHHQTALRKYLLATGKAGKTIGFVPTMGALHAGHISLIARSKSENTLTVCSIFVNPTQFNNAADLEKYPRTAETDMQMLIGAGCDILYMPAIPDVYGKLVGVTEHFDFNGLETHLEGTSRPGHFAGVAQVVKLLLEIVQPQKLYMGQKDFQQWLIVRRLVDMTGMATEVICCPIYRELNGLAMSSRNVRLSAAGRERAAAIYSTLRWAKASLPALSFAEIERQATQMLDANPDFKTDYFKILRADDLQPAGAFSEHISFVIVTAVEVEGVRLLDNVLAEPV